MNADIYRDLELDEIPAEEEREGFKIADDNTAEWALKKIAAHVAELARMTMICDAEIERYQAIKQREQMRCQNNTSYLNSLLFEYFNTVPHQETKTQQKYRLPSGDLVLKMRSPEYERDDEKLIAYCRSVGADELVKVKESLEWGEFKKRLEVAGDAVVDCETGEVIPGCVPVPREPEFEVKVKPLI